MHELGAIMKKRLGALIIVVVMVARSWSSANSPLL
jgi:hypothetical protein